MSRPPTVVALVAMLMIALGETAGAVMSQLRPELDRYARARVAASPQTHGLAGSAEYDEEVAATVVFTVEAGLSFFHTHAEGVGLVTLAVGTLVASLVPWRRPRAVLYALVVAGGLFPLGYLVYGGAVLAVGRDAGIELAERWVLTPLGSAMIAAVVALGLLALLGRRRPPPGPPA
jgi:hypothetical protein